MSAQAENNTDTPQPDPNAAAPANANQPATGDQAGNTANSADDEELKKRDTVQWYVGLVMIITGLLGLLVSALCGEKYLPDNGGVPAASMLFVLLGIAFFFPDLLKAPDNSFSTMRVIVFIVVAVFVVLCVKIGWGTRSFDALRIDSSWVYILGLAFGSKVFQSFGEKKD